MKRLLIGMGLLVATTAQALPVGGQWIDGGGLMSCFYCDGDTLTDCMVTDLLYREVVGLHGLHVSEQFINGTSLLTGLPYRGRLSLVLHYNTPVEGASEVVHWDRSDGFSVDAQRNIRGIDTTDGGYDVLHDRARMVCH